MFREIPGENKRIQATYTDKIYYHGHSITPFILKDRTQNENLFVIMGIVNSKLLSWYASYKSPNFSKNTFPKLNPQDIKELPIPNAEIMKSVNKDFIRNVKKILNQTEELKTIQNQFIDLLQSKFELDKLSTKVENWYDLEFKDFLKELIKIKAKLSLSQEAEWMNYFKEQKKIAQSLKTNIDAIDKEIDQMVYTIYDLTEDEIKIVEVK